MLLYNTVHQPSLRSALSPVRCQLLCESPPAAFPFDGSESARAISTVSPSGRPRNSQSRVTPGNLRTIRTAISLLGGAPHSTLLHLPRSTPRSSANFCWPPRPLKPIASRKRRARFDSSLPGKFLQSTTSLLRDPAIKSGNSKIVPRQRSRHQPSGNPPQFVRHESCLPLVIGRMSVGV